jgi:hypothetical protein
LARLQAFALCQGFAVVTGKVCCATWRKKEAHGKANARALTAVEAAKRDLEARERQDKKQRPAAPERVPEEADEEIRVPATPEQSLPPSTAPARLASEGEGESEGEGRGKRKRKMTEAYMEVRQAGLQSLRIITSLQHHGFVYRYAAAARQRLWQL